MKPIRIWYVIVSINGGESARLEWFLTSNEAIAHEDKILDNFGESTIGSVHTFDRADIYYEAVKNRQHGGS
jgi:hypothetical protein